MKPVLATSMDQMISALGMELIPNVPGDPVTMNRLLLKNIEMQKLMIAALDVGIDWDTYQIWVEPGELRTKIVPVQNGDVVVVKVINWDQDNAEPIYYGQNPLVLPPTNEGLLFPQTSIQAPAIFFDFNEGKAAVLIGWPSFNRPAANSSEVTGGNWALGSLPGDYEKVVRMYDLEGRPIGEVAAELGRSEGAVYMLRARAHDRLREQMGPASKFFTHAP